MPPTWAARFIRPRPRRRRRSRTGPASMAAVRAATVGANKDISPAFDTFLLIDEAPPANPLVSSVSQSGWIFGGFAGGQKQWGNWVLGIEADFDAADIKGNTGVTTSFTEPGCVGFCTLHTPVSVHATLAKLGPW